MGFMLFFVLRSLNVRRLSQFPRLCQGSWQFISLLFSQHKKLNERIKTTSEKGMQVRKRIDVKHTQVF